MTAPSYAQIFTHCVSTKTYELVGIFQPKSTEMKTAWVSLDQYEATIKDVNPASIDNQMERNAKSHKFPSPKLIMKPSGPLLQLKAVCFD